jgi:hypothetical protein
MASSRAQEEESITNEKATNEYVETMPSKPIVGEVLIKKAIALV